MAGLRNIAAAAALVCAVAACNSSDLPPASQYATVSGVILDHTTNRPIAGATITIDTILTAVTDTKGKFTVDRVPTGDFDYNVKAKGYKSFNGSGRAEPGSEATLNLQLDTTAN